MSSYTIYVTGPHLVPDLYPEACNNHDKCYEICGIPKTFCDVQFFYETGGSSLYFAGVFLGGFNAYKRAQEKACSGCSK
jgi:hypothetical protein